MFLLLSYSNWDISSKTWSNSNSSWQTRHEQSTNTEVQVKQRTLAILKYLTTWTLPHFTKLNFDHLGSDVFPRCTTQWKEYNINTKQVRWDVLLVFPCLIRIIFCWENKDQNVPEYQQHTAGIWLIRSNSLIFISLLTFVCFQQELYKNTFHNRRSG